MTEPVYCEPVITTHNRLNFYPSTIEIHTISKHELYTNININNFDLTKLIAVIASTIATASPIIILDIPSFTHLDIKSYFHSIITQLIHTSSFLPLLNSTKTFVSLSNVESKPTIDVALYTQLSKNIPTLAMKIQNPESTAKSRVKSYSY